MSKRGRENLGKILTFVINLRRLAPETLDMKRNIGGIDRGIRILCGLILVALASAGRIHPLGLLGVVPVIAGFVAWCPLYSLLRIDTWSVTQQDPGPTRGAGSAA